MPLRNINKKDSNTMTFCVMSRDCDRVKSITEQMGVKATVLYAKGLPVLAKRYAKRAGLIIGAVLGAAAVFISSRMIWEIRVEGNENVTDEEVIRIMKGLGISEGSIKNTENLEYIYNSFLLKEKRISWIAVNFDGTIAHIEVKEAETVPEKLDRDKAVNIVAKCDGVIRKITVLDGQKEAEVGETVSKGDLLISSFTNTRKNSVLMHAARGSVWATTERCYEITVPKQVSVKKFSGNEKTSRTLNILGLSLPLDFGKCGFETYDTVYETVRPTVFNICSLPFTVSTETYMEYDPQTENITLEQAYEIAENELNRRIFSELEEAEIIQREESVSETEDTFVFVFKLSCVENIAEEKEFEFIDP